jgi:hypothetical protein
MKFREIAIAAVIPVVAVAGVFALRIAAARSGWMRRSVRALGVLLIVTAALAALDWYARTGPRMPAPVFAVESPNGRFIAKVVEPDGDLLPTQVVRISVRGPWRFLAEEVYAGEQEPNIRWIGDHTLELTYPVQAQSPYCASGSSGLDVICKEVRKEDFKPHLRI